jgi:hypothetical protein
MMRVKSCGKYFNLRNVTLRRERFSDVLIPSKRRTTCYYGLVQDTEEQDENHSLEHHFDQFPISEYRRNDYLP